MNSVEMEKKRRHVVILATSDVHGDLFGFSYEDDAETKNSGAARLYTYVQKVRKENPVTFLIDGGDCIQGTIMTDDICSKTPDEPHPSMEVMNLMGYDAMTLGNHEFDFGVRTMEKILSQAKFPILSANVRKKDGSCVTDCGWTILEKCGIRLAVIGVCTPDVPILEKGAQGLEDLTFEDASDAVGRALWEIGESGAKPDLIMVSAHMGLMAEYDEDGGSDAAERIWREHPQVDVLQVGHMHIQVREKHGKTLIGGVRNSGREVARFDVILESGSAGTKLVSAKASLVDMTGVEPGRAIGSIPFLRKLHEKTRAWVGAEGEDGTSGEVLGRTSARFQPDDEIRGISQGFLEDTAVPDLINKIQMEASGADVSACSLFKEESDLPAGDITYKNIFDIYKFTNTLYRVPVTGRELKAYMEWAVSGYNRWQSGDINISFNPEVPFIYRDFFAGVDYEVNLSKPVGERIENVMYHGSPLRDDEMLKLAVSNYRYAAVIKTQHIAEGRRDWESSVSVRDMIVAYFAAHSPIDPEVDHNWRITGVDLGEDDPRRAEIIALINKGLLPVPHDRSYRLEEYDKLIAQARAQAGAHTRG